jgi:hypothetical protein
MARSGSQPHFGLRRTIVVDDTPLPQKNVSRIPTLRVGVPTDEEGKISGNPHFPQSFLMQNLNFLLKKFI